MNNYPRSQQINPPQNVSKSINVLGVPSVHIENNRLVVGSSQSSSTRSYTPLKVLGDGSFGTVWLCDWHGTLPPNTPLSPMQCGAGARPEWAGKRLVAVKRMKKRWEGGWDECQQLKELESLRAIPFHPNIIPLYDFFLLPGTKELYFVFESMEGNLYHLIKARKGRPLAGGLVSSIFFQIVSGLDHIHANGYFHRDMKPENVLVTTTGLFDYTPLSPVAAPNTTEKDVVAIIKLADFGLARETKSLPPYTEYVSTRWYRAPEVLFLSRDYSNPVDMWALGTIMAELVNLRPLFPGSDQLDQIARICDVLGNPCNDYGLDSSGAPLGGGAWLKGLQMAQQVGFEFRPMQPQDIHALFDRSVPTSLIHCIRDLLRFDPDARLTSHQCLHHRYLVESLPLNDIPLPPGVRLATSHYSTQPLHASNGIPPSISSLSPRSIPPSHSHTSQLQIPTATASHRSSFFPASNSHHHSPSPSPSPGPSSYTNGTVHAESRTWTNGGDYSMDTSPDISNGGASDYSHPPNGDLGQSPQTKLGGKLSGFSKKWGLGRFGSDKHQQQHHHHELPPVHEIPAASSSTGTLKRTQSAGSDNRSLKGEPSSPREPLRQDELKRLNKKEAEKVHREAEKQRRALAQKMQREQARAVMQKRNIIIQHSEAAIKEATPFIEWRGAIERGPERGPALPSAIALGKQAATGPIRRDREHINGHNPVNVSPVRFGHVPTSESERSSERMTKVRRMEFDDDVSISSSDVHSSRMSAISFATVDSDPGPSRIRNRPSLLGLNRVTSTSSSLRTFDDYSHPRSHSSARSSISNPNSFSLDGQLAHDFRTRASVNADGPGPPYRVNGSVSPPPMQTLSLSPSLSPSPISLPPSPQWMQVPHQRSETLSSRRGHAPPPHISVVAQPHPSQRSMSYSPYELDYRGQNQFHHQGNGNNLNGHAHPPDTGHTNKSSSEIQINPIFKVVSYKWDVAMGGTKPDDGDLILQPPLPTPTSSDPTEESFDTTTSMSLPPFSTLEAVAGGGGYDYPPLSPMSFNTPSEAASSP
ncbi:Pkinase-domain-containing protein [Gymnopus androsaceus JB14]|uniref:Pkinase-domain-containing protein n=1 Tax=Gymnopus androsaceus JB14 TaxID=1447944 RepID=A0A6A4IH69_9AGAR|nr:Pkinase-domain-containing protein [Gymnopus androsaceus JB14]